MDRKFFSCMTLCLLAATLAAGCQSPYRADQGALFGGLLGAGTGAIVGDAVGNAGAGTAIGAGIGALTGATVGNELDKIEARNRAMIAEQLGREIAAQPVSIDDVVTMTEAGVSEELIVNHVSAHGSAVSLTSAQIIYLTQHGVSPKVIKAMQSPPARQSRPVVIRETAPPPVVVEEYHYGAPWWWRPRPRYGYRHRVRPGLSWGFSYSN